MKNNNNSLKEKAKKGTSKAKQSTKKGYQKTKQGIKKGKKQIDKVRQSSTWQKTKQDAKKATSIVGSHLAATRASITLSNEEAKLMEKLKSELNKKGIYPSKSEILRAGLWSLRNKKPNEVEKAIEDLFKVKQTRVL